MKSVCAVRRVAIGLGVAWASALSACAVAQPARAQATAPAKPASAAPSAAPAVVPSVAPPVAPPVAPSVARSVAPPEAAQAPTTPAATGLRVIEDDQVRIEEARVRGQLQRVTVAPKAAAGRPLPPYEINVGSGGRDPSQDKSAAGQRVWSVWRF